MADEDAVTSKDVRPPKKAATKVLGGPPPEEDADVAGRNVGSIESIKSIAEEEKRRMKEEAASKVLEGTSAPGKVLMKMERRNASWTTRSNVVFTQEHPFQLVPEDEVIELIKEGGFRRADPQEVVFFYQGA